MLPHAQSQVKSSVGFQFVAVPVELLERTDLSPAAKLLAGVVLDSARGSRAGSCKLSNASLGARIGMSGASAKRLLAELEALGVIRRETIAAGRIRTAIRPTWVDQIRATEQASVAQDHPRGGADLSQGVARDRATIQTPGSELSIRPGSSSISTGEKSPDPKPSPSDIAAAMRAMIAGKFAPLLFDDESQDTSTFVAQGAESTVAQSTPAPVGARGGDSPPAPRPNATTTMPRRSTQELATSPLPSPAPYLPQLGKMLSRVGYSARAAAFRPTAPKKSAAQQLAELAEASHRRSYEGGPGPRVNKVQVPA